MTLPSPGDALCMGRTFLVVCAGWVLFRAEDLGSALGIYRRLGWDGWGPGAFVPLGALLEDAATRWTLVHLAIQLVAEWRTRRSGHPLQLTGWTRPLRWSLYTLLCLDVLARLSPAARPFLYFRF